MPPLTSWYLSLKETGSISNHDLKFRIFSSAALKAKKSMRPGWPISTGRASQVSQTGFFRNIPISYLSHSRNHVMLKILIVVAVGFILYKLLTNDQKKKKEKVVKEQEKMAANGVMVKDPICGTYVDKDSDIRVKKDKDVLCFCSYDCRDKYLKRIGAYEAVKKEDA
jgi:YHS domain-containing protein